MQAIEFSIGGARYRAGRLDAFVQNHIARKMAAVWIFIGSRQKSAPGEKPPTSEDFAKFIVTSSGNLPNDDVDYVVGACLSVVQREQQGGAWAPVRTATGELMFPLSLVELMQVVWNVVSGHGIVDFFFDAPSSSTGP